jgi:DNA-binding NarL/FixJ family response regulator
MLQAGAAAFVSKDEGAEGVLRALRAVHAGPVASGGTRVSFVIPAHAGDLVGRPEDLGSDPLDELHSLSETNP